nr:hypothetical protein [Tanacetum cinerariifolium]
NLNLNGNGNVVAARAQGNANGNNARQNRNQIRCYNYRGVGHYARKCTVRLRRRDAAYLQTQLLIAQKEEAGIQLQAGEYDLVAVVADIDEIEGVNANCILMANLQKASTSGTQTDSAPVYDSDGSAEVHENYDDNKIFNMFTQEEQYTELLKPIPGSHQVPQNDNNVISEDTSVEQGGETVDIPEPQQVVEMNDLSNTVTSNLVPTITESKDVINDTMIPPVMFRINSFKTSREDKFVPINKVRASVRTNLITVSQPHVITKKHVNSDSNALFSIEVDNTAKTIRPQPRSNTKNDRVPSTSKSSCIKNKDVEVEEHHRNLLLSKNKKHMKRLTKTGTMKKPTSEDDLHGLDNTTHSANLKAKFKIDDEFLKILRDNTFNRVDKDDVIDHMEKDEIRRILGFGIWHIDYLYSMTCCIEIDDMVYSGKDVC